MKPLIVLLSVFIVSLLASYIFQSSIDIALAGRIAMCTMMIFSAIGHFAFPKGMALMLPNIVPFKLGIIYISGILEILLAIGLLIKNIQTQCAWMLIIFFILILPANIYAAIKQVDFQKATNDGMGIKYLWFRIPLQLLFIVWTYLAAIYHT